MKWVRRNFHFHVKVEGRDVTVDTYAVGYRAIALFGMWHFFLVYGRQGGPCKYIFTPEPK